MTLWNYIGADSQYLWGRLRYLSVALVPFWVTSGSLWAYGDDDGGNRRQHDHLAEIRRLALGTIENGFAASDLPSFRKTFGTHFGPCASIYRFYIDSAIFYEKAGIFDEPACGWMCEKVNIFEERLSIHISHQN